VPWGAGQSKKNQADPDRRPKQQEAPKSSQKEQKSSRAASFCFIFFVAMHY
jgi:hypothetical protein